MIIPSLTIQNGTTGMEVLVSPGGGSPDGSLFVQAQNDYAPTRVQLQPTAGTLPTQQSGNCLAELTLANTPDPVNYGRLNISSMPDKSYRVGQECGGTAEMQDLIYATESSGSSHVTPGTEVYLKIDKNRVGDSQPVALEHGHLRFDVDNMGGDGSEPYVGRGGGGNLSVNGSPGGGVTLLAGNASVLETAGGVLNLPNAEVIPPVPGSPGYLVIKINGTAVRIPFYVA